MNTDRLDHYAQSTLTPEEARELAQQSLESPELFDELTYTALAKSALPAAPRRKPIRMWYALAAAAVLLVGLYTVMRPAAPIATVVQTPPVFRGVDGAAPAPRAIGKVMLVEDGEVTVDLGAVDGVSNGAELTITRNGSPVAHLKVTAVFRARSRAPLSAGQDIRPGDAVHLGDK